MDLVHEIVQTKIAPYLEERTGISKVFLENALLHDMPIQSSVRRKLKKISLACLGAHKSAHKRKRKRESENESENSSELGNKGKDDGEPKKHKGTRTTHRRNFAPACFEKLKTFFRDNGASSEVSPISWAIRRVHILEGRDGMITEKSIRDYAASHRFDDLEKCLCEVNASKGYANHPYKTRSAQKAFYKFLTSIGCKWNVVQHDAPIKRSQRVMISGYEYVYDLDTQRMYRGECNESGETCLTDCIGTWTVSKKTKSKWEKGQVINMKAVGGEWCPLEG